MTRLGSGVLREWLDADEPVRGVSRDGLLLKLFFGANADAGALRQQVAERKRLAEEQLAELEQIERTIDRDLDFFPYLTLLHGLEDARSTIVWAEQALEALERRWQETGDRARA